MATSTAGENYVVQMIGSLYDSIEATYGRLTTRLYRALRPRPVKAAAPMRLRKLCCIPYAVVYIATFLLAVAEIILIIISAEDLGSWEETEIDLNRLILQCIIVIAVILGVIAVTNIHIIARAIITLVFSQRAQLQSCVSKNTVVQSEGYLQVLFSWEKA